MAKKDQIELYTEIMASERLGAFQNYSTVAQPYYSADNPTATWEQLKANPWIAMAIYWDMEEKNAAIYSGLDTRKNNVLSKPRNVLPASESRQDKKIAAFVEDTLKNDFRHFDDFLYEALDAIGKGVSIGEIIFAEGSDRIYIEKVNFKPQHLFSFGATAFAGYSTASMVYPQTGPLQLRAGVMLDNVAGTELPEKKFFIFSFRPKHGNRWGDPMDRKAFWWDFILRASLKNWLKYQEKGSGVIQAKYPSSAGEKEQNDALAAATAMHDETAVATPDKFELVVHEMVRNIGSSHKELVDDYCTAQISRLYLGQAQVGNLAGGGGSRSRDEVAERVSDKISETDCTALMQAVNDDIIPRLVHLNFGPNAAVPKWIIEYKPKEDLDSKAKRYGIIRKEIGLEISKQQVRDDLQLEEPLDDDDALGAPVEATAEPDPPNDSKISEFAEKKKRLHGSAWPSSLRMERFTRLRPSMIEFSDW